MSGHAERTHRLYSPSRAERIAACPGSVRLEESVPARPPTSYSIEGQKAHVIVEAALANGVRRAMEAHRDYSFLCMEELDTNTGGPYKNFYLSIQIMLNHVYAILDEHPDAILFTETFVDPPSDAAPGEVGGWCDVAIYIPSRKWLYIIDYKHGAGVTKAVYGNRQVLQYGAGFLYDANSPLIGVNATPGGDGCYCTHHPDDPAHGSECYKPRSPDVEGVTLCIVQPRAFHPDGEIREYDVTPYELFEYLDKMDEAIRAAQAPDAPLIPEDLTDPHGSRQCQFCDAAATCPARTAKALAAVNVQFAAVRDIRAPGIPDPAAMQLAELEYAAMHLPTLRAWIKNVEDRLFEYAKQGYPLEHHKIVETQARRKWYGDVDEVATKLAALIGCPVEQVIERTLIPITDAEKLIVNAFKDRAAKGKKRDAAHDGKTALAYLTLKQSTGNLTLVTNDDPRPAVDRATVAFQQIGGLLPGNDHVIGDD